MLARRKAQQGWMDTLQGLLQFFDKQAFAADFGERFVENLVAARGHAENLHVAFGIEGLQARLNMLGLPHGQRAFAAGDNEFAGCHDGFEGWKQWPPVYHVWLLFRNAPPAWAS